MKRPRIIGVVLFTARPAPLRWLGVGLILFTALARVLTSPSRVPYWDIDPLSSWTPDTTRTPAVSLLFDALAWLAAGMITLGEAKEPRGVAWRTGILAIIGCLGVMLHGWILTPLIAAGGSPATQGDFQSMTVGSAWASAIIGGWALSMAARDPGVRRFAAITLLGVIVVLAAKGAMQVFVDHPRLVADFQRNKAEMLTAQGIDPESTNARLFERRLMQPEATGWFGLSNVYGSMMAAGMAGFLALALGARRRDSATRGEAAILWTATTAAAFGLALSQSKGAIGAGLLACACVVLAFIVIPAPGDAESRSSKTRMLARALRWTPIALPAIALLAVIARGLIGERSGELSLFFRWQYLLAAGRIFAAHPLFGAGPGGFKDQYLLFKEPTNPEEVDSPHCLPMDWLATLGLFGIAWIALWLTWLWRTGALTADTSRPRAGDEPSNPRGASAGETMRPLLVIAPALAYSLWCEWALYLPEALVVMTLSCLGWWLAARACSHADDASIRSALFAAAVVLGTHCLIEVTGIWQGSAAWVLAMIGLASAGGSGAAAEPVDRITRKGEPLTSLLVLGFVCLAGHSSILFLAEEKALHREAIRVRLVAEADDVRRRLAQPITPSERAPLIERWREIAKALSGADPERIRSDPGFSDEVIDRERERVGSAWNLLWLAYLHGYGAPELADLVSRYAMLDYLLRNRALERIARTPESDAFARQIAFDVIEVPKAIANRLPGSASAWIRLGAAWELIAPSVGLQRWLGEAADAYERAAVLDPHGLTGVVRLARVLAAMDDAPEAARWARRALEVNQRLRLDPLKQLTDTDRAELERIASAEDDPRGEGRQ